MKEYNEHPFITHPNAKIVTIFLYLLYYLVHTHAHIFAESLANRFRHYMYCFWPLKHKNKDIILNNHNIIITSKSQQWCHSITHGDFQVHKLFVLLERWSLISLPLWAGRSGSLPVTRICQKWWNLTLEIGLWKHCGFCFRYILLNSLGSLLLREAKCYMVGYSGRQLHGPGAQELRPVIHHVSETGSESSFSWILRW